MGGPLRRSIKFALIGDGVGPVSAEELVATPTMEWELWRRMISDARQSKPPRHIARCMKCGGPANRGQGEGEQSMRLILGAINAHYLRNITLNCAPETEEVLAAVAYATETSLLFDWCWDKKIPLKFYGRLDESVAVSLPVLQSFLSRKSSDHVCKLVQYHHAKVIWWRGSGVYIGSANLTDSAWNKNIEAGCYFEEHEITDDMAEDLLDMFAKLESQSTPLTDELFKEMKLRAAAINASRPDAEQFWNSPSFNKWPGLVTIAAKAASDRKKDQFLKEWHATLQDLRDLGMLVSQDAHRPSWVSKAAPIGAQADQFLHEHYYTQTFDGRKANYETFHRQNRTQRKKAVMAAVHRWHQLAVSSTEERMINETAPFLRTALTDERLAAMTYSEFRQVCERIHAITDYSRRVPNKAVGLPDDGTRYTIPEKTAALSKRIWADRTTAGHDVRHVLRYVLYGGSNEQLPERLWQAIKDPRWKLDGLGISALGEIVGWALPDRFPPRNGRTSKALKSLGYDVTIHVE